MTPENNTETEGKAAVDLSRLVRRVDRMSDEEIAAAIDASHPIETGVTEADTLAMKLVGSRHGKRDLVDLVRWLLIGAPNDKHSEPAGENQSKP